jgi:hypothetical protein
MLPILFCLTRLLSLSSYLLRSIVQCVGGWCRGDAFAGERDRQMKIRR